MKITKLSTFIVPPRWLFLKIDTDEGISGWGEPILEGHAKTLAAKITELESFLIGEDPDRIEDIWQKIYRNGCYRGGPVLMSALSGIDMALWDIKGKKFNVPIYQLLGGPVREHIRTYRWAGGDRPRDLINGVKSLQKQGFTAVKFNVCSELQIVDSYLKVDKIVNQLSNLRDAVGISMDLVFDFHGRVHYPMAKILLKELEHLKPLFVEDPVAAQHTDALPMLSSLTSIPICVGERLHSRFDFKTIFETRSSAIINPDVSHVGGISELVRIGHMAEAYDIALAPHCPLGPIALAASLQVDAICHNAFIQEQSIGIHYNKTKDLNDYLTDESKFVVSNGFLAIPKGPGLGVVINEGFLSKQSKEGHDWRAPVWRHEDGSVAEW
jgi:galactonate dehydratase